MSLSRVTKQQHQQVAAIAVPMVLANLTVPMLGMVDTAVMGHLAGVHYLAGVAVGGLVINLILWLCGFLRMSTTGATAQAMGQQDEVKQVQLLLQGGLIALLLGIGLVALQSPLWWLADNLIKASSEVAAQGEIYVSIRLLAAPAGLVNLVIMGWLIGQQKSKQVMRLLLLCNVVNIMLDVLFVVIYDGKTAGVAWASNCSEFLTCLLGIRICFQQKTGVWQQLSKNYLWATWSQLKPILSVNRDILLRSMALQLCLAFMTAQAARIGDYTLAANTVLMNFLLLISYGQDGIAYAAEAMVGEAYGSRSVEKMKQVIRANAIWTAGLATAFSIGFWVGGEALIGLLTNQEAVQASASEYLTYVIVLPLIGAACFLLDGIFIGLMAGRAMRNSMFIAVFLVFFPVWWWFSERGNHALWIAFLSFLLARGLTLGWHLKAYWNGELILPKVK